MTSKKERKNENERKDRKDIGINRGKKEINGEWQRFPLKIKKEKTKQNKKARKQTRLGK